MEILSATERISILQECHAIELASFELYSYFAKLFRTMPEISDLWKKTALEEERHATQFIMAAGIPGDLVLQVKTTPQRISRALADVTALLEEVKKNPPTIEEALALAVEMESRLVDLHMDCVLEFCHDPYNQLFREMMEADRNHAADLEKAHRQFSVLPRPAETAVPPEYRADT